MSLGFYYGFFVDNVDLSGGIAIFWNNKTTISLLGHSTSHIDVSIS